MEVNSVAHQLEVLPDPDKDEYYYIIKKRIYQAAKDGHSLSLQNILNRVDDVGIKTVLVNQVRRNIIANKHQHELSVRKKKFQENVNFAEKERKDLKIVRKFISMSNADRMFLKGKVRLISVVF